MRSLTSSAVQRDNGSSDPIKLACLLVGSVETHLDPVCAALAPNDPQGYAVKPLDICR